MVASRFFFQNRNQQMLNFFQANIDLSKDLEKKVLDKEQELAQHRGVVEGVRVEAEALRGDLDAERRERAAVERRNADLTDRIQELERQRAQADLDKEQAQAETRELQGIFRPIVEAIGSLVKFFKELHDAAAEAGPELDGPGLDGPGAAVAQLPIVRSRKRRHQEEDLDRLKGGKRLVQEHLDDANGRGDLDDAASLEMDLQTVSEKITDMEQNNR